jgi:hypothetical protein
MTCSASVLSRLTGHRGELFVQVGVLAMRSPGEFPISNGLHPSNPLALPTCRLGSPSAPDSYAQRDQPRRKPQSNKYQP